MKMSQPRQFGRPLTEEQEKADLERYKAMALELGASDAAVIAADSVEVDERVRLKCTIPRCTRAGETPNCPPYAPDLETVRKAIARYSSAVLFKCEVAPIADYVPGRGTTRAEQRQTLLFHKKGSDIVYALERQAYKDGYHLAMGLGEGRARTTCARGRYANSSTAAGADFRKGLGLRLRQWV